jgi:hypothetical protein
MGKLVKWLIRVNRINMLLIMHHIALCTSCIPLFNCGHLLHIRVVGGPQASSSEDANIVVIKTSSGALTNNPYLLLLNLVFCSFMSVH